MEDQYRCILFSFLILVVVLLMPQDYRHELFLLPELTGVVVSPLVAESHIYMFVQQDGCIPCGD